MSYKIKLDMFEGPLDLLLYLIKKNDIDITNIPIIEVTEQYLQYIDMMQMLDLDAVGDFLVMAATLIHIKSKMLLPPDPLAESEEELDPRAELVQRLQEYQKFRQVAEDFKNKEVERQNLFARLIDEETKSRLVQESREVSVDTSLFDLINALYDALKKSPKEVLHEVTAEEFTLDQKIHDILHLLVEKKTYSLTRLFLQAKSRKEMVTTFLATLELVRLKEVLISQDDVFGEIQISRNDHKITPPPSSPEPVVETVAADHQSTPSAPEASPASDAQEGHSTV